MSYRSLWVSTIQALTLFILVTLRLSAQADEFPTAGITAQSSRGMVVSVSQPASEVGYEILQAGGNAVDAAVAVGFALAVTWPEAGNIGGGGFMLVLPPNGKQPTFFDYRERAPDAATVDMFAKGTSSQYPLVGVPGTVRGLKLAHQRFGRLPWATVVSPSVKLAREGTVVSAELAASLNEVLKTSRDNLEFQRVFGPTNGKSAWAASDVLRQPDLAATLQLIATEGSDAFYLGVTADALVAEMKQGGGLITRDDLTQYQAHERKPVHGTYRGYDVYASPPPSSGGTALIQMLNIAEPFDLRQSGRYSAKSLHVMIECMRRGFCDRARHLGDPDFHEIPPHLVSKEYAAKLREGISTSQATSSSELGADILATSEGQHTTHFSVIDQDGLAVANTYTLEDSYGSRIVVRKAGFILNNEMGDFNPQPGVTNDKGLIGTTPNLVAPGKRMLSSMTPTIVAKDGRVVLITGSPGGRTIINTVFCVVMNVLEFEMPLREAVDAPRMHHQWMPDKLRVEPELLKTHADAIDALKQMGHAVDARPARQGDANSIIIDGQGQRIGAADRRRKGWAIGQATSN